MDINDLQRMKLHEVLKDGDITVLKVDGGWIYYREDSKVGTFVPRNYIS